MDKAQTKRERCKKLPIKNMFSFAQVPQRTIDLTICAAHHLTVQDRLANSVTRNVA